MGTCFEEDKEMKRPCFTVVVAMYNAADTICRCLDSLLAQTLTDIQIVCIDDHSTDDTLQKACGYMLRDERVEVLHLSENRGPAHARNAGLRHARGKYTTFLDSDDLMASDALELAAQSFEAHDDTDCVMFTVLTTSTTGQQTEYYMPTRRLTGNEAFDLSLDWTIHGLYAWRTPLHERFPYDETCRTFSDDNTTRMHYLHSRYVDTCKGVYHYIQRLGSISTVADMSRLNHLVATASMKKQLLMAGAAHDILCKYENVRWLVLVDTLYFLYSNRHRFSSSDVAAALDTVHQHWQSIEARRLKKSLKYKLGYAPMRFSWRLFLLEERVYFWLKLLLGRC